MKWIGALLFCFSIGLLGAAPSAPGNSLAGTWRIDPAKSTELSPWKTFDLVVTVDGPRLTLTRKLAWGRREVQDLTTLDLSKPVSDMPITWWPDNRHLGAYIGHDKTKHVRAEWLDGGRLLRTSADLVLSTQQGDRAINILTDYKVSESGTQLTLIELRSTRNRPIVYIFTRVQS
jgi:hypothetical protein